LPNVIRPIHTGGEAGCAVGLALMSLTMTELKGTTFKMNNKKYLKVLTLLWT